MRLDTAAVLLRELWSAYIAWTLIPAGLLALLIGGMWTTSRRHRLAKADPLLKFLDTASPSGLHPDTFHERVASYADSGLLRSPLLLRRIGYLMLVVGISIILVRRIVPLMEGTVMFSRILEITLSQLSHWIFWVWLTVVSVANLAAKRAEARSPSDFMICVTIRAVCVAGGACLFLARAAPTHLNFGAAQYSLALVGVIAAVVSLLVLNQIPIIQRLFVSESVQIFWEGAVPALLVVGLAQIVLSAVGCIGFAIAALVSGSLLVGVPGLYFVLSKQIGTPTERHASARIVPLFNAFGGLLSLQIYLSFLVVTRT